MLWCSLGTYSESAVLRAVGGRSAGCEETRGAAAQCPRAGWWHDVGGGCLSVVAQCPRAGWLREPWRHGAVCGTAGGTVSRSRPGGSPSAPVRVCAVAVAALGATSPPQSKRGRNPTRPPGAAPFASAPRPPRVTPHQREQRRCPRACVAPSGVGGVKRTGHSSVVKEKPKPRRSRGALCLGGRAVPAGWGCRPAASSLFTRGAAGERAPPSAGGPALFVPPAQP